MNTKEIFKPVLTVILVITCLIFFFNACNGSSGSEDNNPPDGRPDRPIIFNETEKLISYESQSVSFIADRTDFWIPFIWETIGTEVISHAFTYDQKTQQIEGDWFTIKVDKNTVTVDIYENNNDKERILRVNATAEAAYKLLTIKQTIK